MKTTVWLTYDLGVKGDYNGLFQWLDSHDALECGNNAAFFKIQLKEGENLIEKIESEIRENITISNGERIYLIYRKEDDSIAGKYIIGNRKANPWEGYKQKPSKEDF